MFGPASFETRFGACHRAALCADPLEAFRRMRLEVEGRWLTFVRAYACGSVAARMGVAILMLFHRP
jgi:hypothetical protein